MLAVASVYAIRDTRCEVTCGDGYYACCTSDWCRCRRNDLDDDICNIAGGEGATSCAKDDRARLD